MPIDLQALSKDPDFQKLSPAEQQELMATAHQRNQAEQPPGPTQVISSAGDMVKALPGLVYNATVAPLARAGGYGTPAASPAAPPATPPEWDTRLRPLEQQTEEGVRGAIGLMMGPAWGRAGSAAGEALMPYAAPWIGQIARTLPAVGEATGSYTGRQMNVAMGAEQPGTLGDIASAALPLAVRGATSAPAARRMPGAAVAQHEMVAEDLGAMTTRMQPATPADTLYRAVAHHHNPAIPAQTLRQTTQDIIARELREDPETRNDVVLRLAQQVEDLATRHNDQIPMDLLYERMQRIGERLRGVQRTDDQGTRELSALYAAFHRALENASQTNIPGAAALQQAIRASRQEHAVERLQRIVGEGRGVSEQQGTGYTLVKGKQMRDAFERLVADDDVFRGSFTADEIAEMRQTFERGVQLPALPVPGSAQRGFGLAGLRAGIGGGVGYALGGQEGAAVGSTAALAAPEVISRLMVTPRGRQILRAVLEGQEVLSPETLAMLNQVVRAQLPGTPYTSKRAGSPAP